MKLRGIEARRRDTCAFIKNMQHALLQKMAEEDTVAGVESLVPVLLGIVDEHVAVLRSGKAPPLELVLKRHITKEAEEYTTNTISATVTKMLEESGVHLQAGESIQYIIVDATGRKQPAKAKPLSLYAFEDGYDIEEYTKLALDAAATLLEPFSYSYDRLVEMFCPPVKRTPLRMRQATAGSAHGRTRQVVDASPTIELDFRQG
jgi:DNA polymerase elongation subunit (family B)